MNSYFQILIDAKGVSLILIPPKDGGEKIRVQELREYLERIGVLYDPMAINSALYNLGEEKVVLFLSPIKIPTVDEKCNLVVSPDKMTVTARIYPPSEGGKVLTKNNIKEDLLSLRVRFGVDEAAIEAAIDEKKYCTDIILAKGKLPTAGRDGKINYYFDTNNKARPEIKEDGSVDYFKLNMLHHCTKGQVLAEIEPAERGEDGVDVFGTVTKAREVKKAKFDHGRNLEISKDGLKLMSMVDGHASLVNGAVFVSDIYSVENVDTSTGNIEYHGNVEVRGNVCENFKIKTDGDVFVGGVVEGAEIEAGGNIVIARGMHGQNKGRLVAGGNVVAKFLSATDVQVKGFVEAEQILNSTVEAAEVHAEAGKGLITGGKIVASKAVNVRNAGSPMGAATIIEVGNDPQVKKRHAELQKDIAEKSKSISQMQMVLKSATEKIKSGVKPTVEQIKNLQMIQQNLPAQQQALAAELQEMQEIEETLKYENNAHIDIRGTMYQGVVVAISGAAKTIKEEYTFCRLINKAADVTSTNL